MADIEKKSAGKIARVSWAERLRERAPELRAASADRLKAQTRRDFLIYGTGAAAAVAGFWWLLPEEAQQRPFSEATRRRLDSLEARVGLSSARSAARRETFLGRVLTFDDDVAEALYSSDRRVRTYSAAQLTELPNNYGGQTPDPEYIADWTLTVTGLASGRVERLRIADLRRFPRFEQVTRLCCVEGWSAISGWAGLRFSDFLLAYPPAPGTTWARLDSSVNLDGDGNPDPYYVSIDLPTARHPQTLLATHNNGKPLSVEHGAPLRLLAPMKLGLKNIKAITKITYTATQPADYWAERGYSKYDGL